MNIDKKELKKFSNVELGKIVPTILEDKDNFEVTAGDIGGDSINIWRINPMVDEGSFIYSDEKARDADLKLLNGHMA